MAFEQLHLELLCVKRYVHITNIYIQAISFGEQQEQTCLSKY